MGCSSSSPTTDVSSPSAPARVSHQSASKMKGKETAQREPIKYKTAQEIINSDHTNNKTSTQPLDTLTPSMERKRRKQQEQQLQTSISLSIAQSQSQSQSHSHSHSHSHTHTHSHTDHHSHVASHLHKANNQQGGKMKTEDDPQTQLPPRQHKALQSNTPLSPHSSIPALPHTDGLSSLHQSIPPSVSRTHSFSETSSSTRPDSASSTHRHAWCQEGNNNLQASPSHIQQQKCIDKGQMERTLLQSLQPPTHSHTDSKTLNAHTETQQHTSTTVSIPTATTTPTCTVSTDSPINRGNSGNSGKSSTARVIHPKYPSCETVSHTAQTKSSKKHSKRRDSTSIKSVPVPSIKNNHENRIHIVREEEQHIQSIHNSHFGPALKKWMHADTLQVKHKFTIKQQAHTTNTSHTHENNTAAALEAPSLAAFTQEFSRTVLLCDEDINSRNTIEAALLDNGYLLIVCHSAAEAMQVLIEGAAADPNGMPRDLKIELIICSAHLEIQPQLVRSAYIYELSLESEQKEKKEAQASSSQSMSSAGSTLNSLLGSTVTTASTTSASTTTTIRTSDCSSLLSPRELETGFEGGICLSHSNDHVYVLAPNQESENYKCFLTNTLVEDGGDEEFTHDLQTIVSTLQDGSNEGCLSKESDTFETPTVPINPCILGSTTHLLEWIQSRPKSAHIPVIVTNVDSSSIAQERWIRRGASDVLTTPLEMSSLLNSVFILLFSAFADKEIHNQKLQEESDELRKTLMNNDMTKANHLRSSMARRRSTMHLINRILLDPVCTNSIVAPLHAVVLAANAVQVVQSIEPHLKEIKAVQFSACQSPDEILYMLDERERRAKREREHKTKVPQASPPVISRLMSLSSKRYPSHSPVLTQRSHLEKSHLEDTNQEAHGQKPKVGPALSPSVRSLRAHSPGEMLLSPPDSSPSLFGEHEQPHQSVAPHYLETLGLDLLLIDFKYMYELCTKSIGADNVAPSSQLSTSLQPPASTSSQLHHPSRSAPQVNPEIERTAARKLLHRLAQSTVPIVCLAPSMGAFCPDSSSESEICHEKIGHLPGVPDSESLSLSHLKPSVISRLVYPFTPETCKAKMGPVLTAMEAHRKQVELLHQKQILETLLQKVGASKPTQTSYFAPLPYKPSSSPIGLREHDRLNRRAKLVEEQEAKEKMENLLVPPH